jgi:spermidine synthase
MPLTLGESIHAVERNPAAVRLFQSIAPKLDGDLDNTDSTHAADGRTVLERLPAGWDAIVVESSLYHPAHLLLPAAAPYFHPTTQADGLMVDRLAPGGVVIQEYNRTASASHRRDMTWRGQSGFGPALAAQRSQSAFYKSAPHQIRQPGDRS